MSIILTGFDSANACHRIFNIRKHAAHKRCDNTKYCCFLNHEYGVINNVTAKKVVRTFMGHLVGLIAPGLKSPVERRTGKMTCRVVLRKESITRHFPLSLLSENHFLCRRNCSRRSRLSEQTARLSEKRVYRCIDKEGRDIRRPQRTTTRTLP